MLSIKKHLKLFAGTQKLTAVSAFDITPTKQLTGENVVYLLLNEGAIVYAGHSVNLYSRLVEHRKRKQFDSVQYVPCLDLRFAKMLEAICIDAIQPPLNVSCRNGGCKTHGGYLFEATRYLESHKKAS